MHLLKAQSQDAAGTLCIQEQCAQSPTSLHVLGCLWEQLYERPKLVTETIEESLCQSHPENEDSVTLSMSVAESES